MEFAAVIRDRFNVIVRVEERPTMERAHMAGRFFTRKSGYWYQIAEGRDSVELFKSMINL